MIFDRYAVPDFLQESMIAVTSAIKGAAWYARLGTYKLGKEDYLHQLAAVTSTFLQRHSSRVSEALGGAPDGLVVVPSKRSGRTFETHPLRGVGRIAFHPDLTPIEALRFTGTASSGHRHRYFPEEFEAGPSSVEGRRVVLLEDTWVTGATMLSAAGALLREGATAVLPMAIARAVDPAYWQQQGADHPYWETVQGPWDPDHWPR